MRRLGRESAAANLILKKDYPKTGYSAQSTLTLVLQTEGRRLLRSFLLMMLVGSGALCGCAPAGHFYETGSFVARPRDACALPETAVGFATSLNKKIGQRDGPRERVASVQGLVASGILIESRDQFVSCRGALVFASGQTQSGTLSVVDRTTGEITQSSWQSDEALKRDEQRTQYAEAERRARSERIVERAALIEKDAVLFENDPGSIALIEKLVQLVRDNGFSCTSVSSARPVLMSRGYVLGCNKFSYTYDIKDKGGNWLVSAR